MSFADPLWEFVLEDYDDDETSRLGKFRTSRGRKVETKPSSGSWGFASSGNSKTSKKENGVEYRDDKEDGFWDVISGAPPAATRRKRSKSYSGRTKSSKGHGLLSKKSILKTSKSQHLIRSHSNLSDSEMHYNDKKKKMIKRRLSWNQSSKSPENISQHSTRNFDAKQKTLASGRNKARTYSRMGNRDSPFDPVDFIFQIADSLDPWGVESSVATMSEVDSHDEIGTVDDEEGDANSNITDRFTEASLSNAGYLELQESQLLESKTSKSLGRSPVHKRNKRSNGKIESLLDQQLPPDPTRFDPNRYPYQFKHPTEERNDYSTEIRLRVNPGGNTLSEETFKTSKNVYEDDKQILRTSQTWDRERYPQYGQSFDASDTVESSQSVEGVLNKPDNVTKERRAVSLSGKKKHSSGEIGVPMNVHITDRGESSIRDKDNDSKKVPKTLKKAVCGLKKVGKKDSMFSLKKSDAAEIFPSSRVIIDGEQHSIIGPNSDPINGVVGESSDPLIRSKGRQSILSYEYDSNMNMDVIYTKPDQNPRTSILVRKLGDPARLWSSSDAESIVVQIEASVVSETDCIIRQGLWWGESKPSFPNTPGITLVGKVYSTKQMTGKTYGLKPMQSVLSLVKWGGNARFMTIHPNQLVKVPEGLDPAEIACLPECYLSAFQVLLMSQTGNNRYRESSMKGKSILILGCMTNNMGKAIIELAFNVGVANIYATAKKKHWKSLISYGVMPLSPDPMEWIQRIAGTMDLVLAPNGNLREDVTPIHFRALRPRFGQLIISGHRIVGNDIPIEAWKKDHRMPTLACGKNKALRKILRNSIIYDVYQEWEKNLDLCKRDLSYLLELLKRKAIKPEVLDRIPLNKIAKAHELLEKKRLPGFLVCEPWMKGKKHAIHL